MLPVNLLAVLIAAVVSMAVGFIYYSPYVVGKPWMKLMGYTEKDMKPTGSEMGKLYGTSLVLAVITAFMLSHIMIMSQNTYNYPALMTGVTSAFFVWLGFVMPVQLTQTLFSKNPIQLFGINTGHQLLALIAMGVTIGLLS